jgi:hypothetical protein
MNLATNYCQMHMHVDASSTENIKYFIEDPIAGVSCNSIPFPFFFIEKSSTKQNNRITEIHKKTNKRIHQQRPNPL